MPTITVPLGERAYDIVIEPGVLQSAVERLGDLPLPDEVAVLSNQSVAPLFADALCDQLRVSGRRTVQFNAPDGEACKNWEWVNRAYDALAEFGLRRGGVVVALGGGVVGDWAGFVAATWMRGVDFVQVPTTLLAMVDSSVGGKVGINHTRAKNLIGAFHQPRFVLIDPDTLRSLPRRERRSGLAEVIKYGIIDDRPFFDLLAREGPALLRLQSAHLEHAVTRSCEIKARIVELDEREGSLRAILNFGHTIGHALEAVTRYRTFRHGEAIAAGMVSAALIGEEVGVTRPEDTRAVADVFQSVGFAVGLDSSLDIDEIVRLTAWDKKSVGGTARFVLMEEIGRVTTGHVVPTDAVRRALERQRDTYDA